MSDVTVASAPRSYPLPKTILEEVERGRQWAEATGWAPSDAASWAAEVLTSGAPITEDLISIIASIAPTDFPRTEELTSARVDYALFGGDQLQRWAGRVLVASGLKVRERLNQTLTDMDYKSDLTYIGICDAEDDSLVRSLVRVGEDHRNWDRWVRPGKWEPVPNEALVPYGAFELDKEFTAVLASALLETDGLMLIFAEPIARLDYEPITAAAPDDVQGAHFYAIVDTTDPTAVMNVVEIAPGPVVSIRQGGKWVVDPKTLDLLTGIQPPPLVELDPDKLKMVLAQVDSGVTTAEQNPDNVESLGHEKEIDAAQKSSAAAAPAAKPASPVTAAVHELTLDRDEAVAQLQEVEFEVDMTDAQERADFEDLLESLRDGGDQDAIDALLLGESERRDEVIGLRAALYDRREAVELRWRVARQEVLLAAAEIIHERCAVTETLANAVPIRAAAGGADQDRGGAEVLRHYWLYGKGALKIKWGTDGDWTRCYRYLSKYLGERAKGYCQLRHIDANGFSTGSRLNR